MRYYAIKGEIKPLPSERDQNWYVKGYNGREFILKISNLQEDPSFLQMQNEVLRSLSSQDLNVQHIFPSIDGKETVQSEEGYLIRLVDYLPGTPLADYKPHTTALFTKIGEAFGKIDNALYSYDHPAAHRELQWDLQNASDVVEAHIHDIQNKEKQALIQNFIPLFKNNSVFKHLRTSVIHNDGNDYNLLIKAKSLGNGEISGILDFGDMVHSYTIAELAIVCAYAMLHKPDPIKTAQSIISGYHQKFPIPKNEIEALFPLIIARLCTSVCLAAFQRSANPNNQYLSISEEPAWKLLARLEKINPTFASFAFRLACGFSPNPKTKQIEKWLKNNHQKFSPIIAGNFDEDVTVLDLSVGTPLMATPFVADDVEKFTKLIFDEIESNNACIGIGQYDEIRLLNENKIFTEPNGNQRNLHLGIDLFMSAGNTIFAPLAGTVYSATDNGPNLDYGPTIILEHDANGETFYTLYGHLADLSGLKTGDKIKQGQAIAKVGIFPQNGNWSPHLHFQLITHILGESSTFPGVADNSQRDTWLSISPDPNLILNIPKHLFPNVKNSTAQLIEKRNSHIAQSLSLSYEKPLKIVRGFMQYLYDENGNKYLDAVNNVPHVGHSNPRVVRAAQKQMVVLNTNTRYLHDNLSNYAEKLTAKLPGNLSVCIFTNSGSEANDLALRMSKIYTGNSDFIVLDAAYHGNLSSLIDISPYKFDGVGGFGKPDHVQVIPMPDPYRYPNNQNITYYQKYFENAITAIKMRNTGVSALIAESLLGCGGQIVLPENFLKNLFEMTREAGGLCIVDEVQVGFGRVGTHFWAFETQDVIPDIVTVGKPIGNGHPIGAVITTPEIANKFSNGMEYFNTFGGNPVSIAIGMAVLDEIENNDLQSNALIVGNYLVEKLQVLQKKYSLIGNVRGLGLFIGVELILDKYKTPAIDEAHYITNRMKEKGVLISVDGPLHNVLKIKPPIIFTQENADELVSKLDQILSEIS
jgi:4-aminobutyrate aminotransferase-like enzyme/Ser/Thr protein kinase RdoA (MazF antagonist)